MLLWKADKTSYCVDSSALTIGRRMDSSATSKVICTLPSACGGVVSAASSSALSALRMSPLDTQAMCSSASSSTCSFI
ncbi:hypothetical protein D3C80_1771260 [compost metagenome]